MSVSKITIKTIGICACLRDMMSQTLSIYACDGTNHASHFHGSRYIMRQLKARAFKVTLEKNLIGRNSQA